MTILTDYIFDSPYALNAKHTPLRYFNHLSHEDQKFVMENFEKFLAPLEKECPRFSFVTQDETTANIIYRPIDILYRMLMIKGSFDKTFDVKIAMHYEQNMAPRIGVGMDFALLRDTYGLDTTGSNVNMLFKCQRSIAGLEFSGLEDVITIINSAGEIFRIMGKSDVHTLFAGLQETLDMLHAFVDIKLGVEIEHWDTLTDLLHNFEECLFYIPDTENLMVLDYILMNTVSIYGFCKDLKKDGIEEEIWNGYLMQMIRESYISKDDFIRKRLQNILDMQRADYIHSQSKNFLCTTAGIMKFEREEDLNIINDSPVKQTPTFEQTLTPEETIGYYNLSRVGMDSVRDAIADKIGIQSDRLSISFDIPEDLLTMYMSEFVCIAPLHIVDGRYLLKYDGNIYRLFVVSNNGASDLAAIAVVGEDRSFGTLELSLLSFTKNMDYKYVFTY